jgi:hypothetical protein
MYTHGGRKLIEGELLSGVLERVREGLEELGVFERLGARLVVFEAGVMPWSLRNPEYLARQCFPAAVALAVSRERALEAIEQARVRLPALRPLRVTATRDREGARQMQSLIGRAAWPVRTAQDIKLAPFQVLATDRGSLLGLTREQQWAELDHWTQARDLFLPIRRIQVNNPADEKAATELWELVSSEGGGVVARTRDWFPQVGERREVAAMKVRGREALRLEYGPMYLAPEQRDRLKERPLKGARQQALREWALAAEGLRLFAEGRGFEAYHAYALGVLACQREPLEGR